MEEHGVVSDVIDAFERTVDLKVNYGDVEVKDAMELRPSDLREKPSIQWTVASHEYYALVMTDPDAPSKAKPTSKEWRHWVVANIQGADVQHGETLSAYAGPAPPPGSGFHRYVFLLFKQERKLHFTPFEDGGRGRAGFCVRKWAQEQGLKPVGGTFFLAKNESD